MHVEADLLDGVGDVEAGERQVLEGPGEALEVSQQQEAWTQWRPWHACPPALKPAFSPPCQLAQEYREQTEAE
jgi:hypothetical protein